MLSLTLNTIYVLAAQQGNVSSESSGTSRKLFSVRLRPESVEETVAVTDAYFADYVESQPEV